METMVLLINRIHVSGSCILILSSPSSALRTHVESLGKPRDVNKCLRALPGKLRHSPSILYLLLYIESLCIIEVSLCGRGKWVSGCWYFGINTINWSAHEMMVLITSACGEGSDEPAYMYAWPRQDFHFSHELVSWSPLSSALQLVARVKRT